MQGNTLVLIASVIVLAIGLYYTYKTNKKPHTH